MNFLSTFDFWNPESWLTSVGDGLMGAIVTGLRTLCFTADTLIYKLIINLYNIFESLCTARLLGDGILKEISTRVGIVLGIIMFFNIIFSFIKMLIDPNQLEDKEQGAGSIVKKVILVIVMLGTANYCFNTLYKIQDLVITEHVISKLILPFELSEETSVNFGGILSSGLMEAFYQVNEELNDANISPETTNLLNPCIRMTESFFEQIKRVNRFDLGYTCLNESVTLPRNEADGTENYDEEVFIISFNWGVSVIAGIFVVYLLLSYCISIGVRMIQLAMLEIISPLAIISYLQPKKDTVFSKWSKIYFSTYIDVFIRIAIISFTTFLIATIFDSNGMDDNFTFWKTLDYKDNGEGRMFFLVIIIIALLTFAKKAPDLIKELLPASVSKLGFGGFKFKDMVGGNLLKKGLVTGGKIATAGAAIGLLGSATSGISRFRANLKSGKGVGRSALGALGGVASALPRGMIAGAQKGNILKNISKGISNQRSIDDQYDELITSGGNTAGKMMSTLSSYFGETKGQTYTRHLNNLDQIDKFKKDAQAAADEFTQVKAAKDAWEQMEQWQNEPLEEYQKRKAEAYKRYKTIRDNAITASIAGDTKYKDIDGNEFDITADDNDMLYSKDIQATIAKADGFVQSHDVQYWNGNSYVKMEKIKNLNELKEAADRAHGTKTKIMSESDYNAAIANDKAAGINSNGGKKS